MEEEKSSKLIISCKKASLLSLQKQHDGIRFWDNIHLFIHIVICKGCRFFDTQSRNLNSLIKRAYHEADDLMSMPQENKERIQKELDKLFN